MNVQFMRIEVQSSEKPKSRLLKNRSLEFWKTEVRTSEYSTQLRMIITILI